MTSRKHLLALLIGFALSLIIAGCGGAPPVVEPTAAPAAPAAAAPAAEEAAPVAEVDIKSEVGAYLNSLPENYNAITRVDAFKDLLATGNVLVVDVREANEYAEGHIPGSVNIPIRTLAQNLDQIPTGQPVVVSCQSGARAAMATTALRLLGYENVRAFPPSMKGWTEANEDVSTEPVAAQSFGAPTVDPQMLAAVDQFLGGLPENYYIIGKPEALNDLIGTGNVTLVDVREPSEFAEGHIPGAINIPVRTLPERLDQIPTGQPVVLYCASGLRCSLATPALHMLGYENVRSFPPSFKGWEAAGLPIEQ